MLPVSMARMPSWSWRSLIWTLGAGVLAFAVLYGLYSYGPAATTIERWAHWLRDLGFVGGACFSCLYALCAAALVPATPFPLTAGFLWGPYWGFLVAWCGEVLGACVSFALGRTLLQEGARRLAERYPLVGALHDAVDEGGWRLLVLVRLSPIFPFGVLNYSLGLTRVRWVDFVTSTVVGVVPALVMLVYAGASLTRFADALSGEAPLGWGETLLTWGGLLVSVVVVVWVSRATREALERRLSV